MPVGAPGSRFALEGWREEIQENVHQNRFFPNPFFLLEVLLINSVLLEVICLSMECAVHCGTLADCANCW